MDSSVRYCGCKWEECEQFASQLQLYASKDTSSQMQSSAHASWVCIHLIVFVIVAPEFW